MLRVIVDRDRHLLCGRPGCFQRLAALGEAWDPSNGLGQWIRRAELDGTGWHLGSDQVWRLESHGRRRVQKGLRPEGAHSKPNVRVEVDWDAVGAFDPNQTDLLRRVGPGRPKGLVVVDRGGPERVVRNGENIACGRCGSVSEVTDADVAVPRETEAKLRAAKLWGWPDEHRA